MTRTRIKICGMTREEDVAAAVSAGADAVGFIFAPSPRRVEIETAARLAAAVPPPVGRVGVFVDAPITEIVEAVERCGLTAVQLCGSEPAEICDLLLVPAIKVIAVGTEFGWREAEPYRGHATAILLDTYDPQRAGGTSQTFAWQEIGETPGWAPFFVAGGLAPHNVRDCIIALRPYAVDVSSGVESAPGIKDHDKIRAFCEAVREADLSLSVRATKEEDR